MLTDACARNRKRLEEWEAARTDNFFTEESPSLALSAKSSLWSLARPLPNLRFSDGETRALDALSKRIDRPVVGRGNGMVEGLEPRAREEAKQ